MDSVVDSFHRAVSCSLRVERPGLDAQDAVSVATVAQRAPGTLPKAHNGHPLVGPARTPTGQERPR